MAEKPTILIADDEVGPREALRFLLKDDFQLLFAEDGIEVLKALKHHSPDIILMDLRMPQLNGWDAIREIRASGNRVPIIVITGFPDPSDRVKVKELQVTKYLSKPFDLFELQELLKSIVGLSTN